MREQPVTGRSMQLVSYATRTLFNALINGNRGYQAPYPGERDGTSYAARVSIDRGGPKVLGKDPAAALVVRPVVQSFDWVHVANMLRMLPAFSFESTSGGWVALPYAFDPPPDIPDIVIPQAQWTTSGGETVLTGLTTKPSVFGVMASWPGTPMPGFAYPGIISTTDNVTSTGTL
jgi:hypothetical protein